MSVFNEQGFIEGRYVPVVDGKSVAAEAGVSAVAEPKLSELSEVGDSAVVEATLSEPTIGEDGALIQGDAGSNGRASASGTSAEPAPAT